MEQGLDTVIQAAHYVVPFLVVLSIVVFVHELGHFWVARRCGVKIEAFSIGFGKEIFGWNDKYGTRWRVAWIPFGGYVKMFGDADPSSFGPSEEVQSFTEEEKKVTFYAKPVSRRFAIVAAGPGFNYLFAILVLAVLFFLNGQPYTATTVATVLEKSAAEVAGIKPGDKVLSIDGAEMKSFEDIKTNITLNTGTPVQMKLDRNGEVIELTVTPQVEKTKDRLGGEHLMGKIGIMSVETAYRELGPVESIRESILETWKITAGTLRGVGQMIMGVRGTEELGGPLRIAEMSGKVAKDGVFALFWFIAVISINLGLINLFPIPLLDGGHLLFYLVEGVRGKPVSDRTQEYAARVGALFVFSLMIFATWNDLVHLRVFSFIRGLFS